MLFYHRIEYFTNLFAGLFASLLAGVYNYIIPKSEDNKKQILKSKKINKLHDYPAIIRFNEHPFFGKLTVLLENPKLIQYDVCLCGVHSLSRSSVNGKDSEVIMTEIRYIPENFEKTKYLMSLFFDTNQILYYVHDCDGIF